MLLLIYQNGDTGSSFGSHSPEGGWGGPGHDGMGTGHEQVKVTELLVDYTWHGNRSWTGQGYRVVSWLHMDEGLVMYTIADQKHSGQDGMETCHEQVKVTELLVDYTWNGIGYVYYCWPETFWTGWHGNMSWTGQGYRVVSWLHMDEGLVMYTIADQKHFAAGSKANNFKKHKFYVTHSGLAHIVKIFCFQYCQLRNLTFCKIILE